MRFPCESHLRKPRKETYTSHKTRDLELCISSLNLYPVQINCKMYSKVQSMTPAERALAILGEKEMMTKDNLKSTKKGFVVPSDRQATLNGFLNILIAQVPDGFFDKWSVLVANVKVNPSEDLLTKSLRSLFTYFVCCEAAAPYKVALPSKLVSVTWQAFIEYDDVAFTKHYGRYFPYAMKSKAESNAADGIALARTYYFNCELEGIDVTVGSIPSLFDFDYKVNMPNGYRFTRIFKPEDGIYHCELDEQGRSANRIWFIHREISVKGLKELDYIPEGTCKLKEGAFRKVEKRGVVFSSAALALCSMFGFSHETLQV